MMMQELMYDVMTGAEEAGRGGWDVRNVCVSGSRQALLFIETAAVPAICGSRRPQPKDLLLLLEYYFHHY